MRDREAARYSAWLDDASAYSSVPSKKAPQGRAGRNRVPLAVWFLLLGLTALVIGIVWDGARHAQARAAQRATFVHPEQPSPPAADEPATTISTRGPGSRAGRLLVVSETGAPGSYVRIALEAEFWDAYVRSGETADIALMPGRYTVELLDRVTGSRRIEPLAIQVESTSTLVVIRNPTPR